MSKKRQTKEQKEQAEREALRQRIDDIFLGSVGVHWDEESDPRPQEFIQFVRSLKRAFCKDEESGEPGNEHLWAMWNLSDMRNPEAATEFLYGRGVRA